MPMEISTESSTGKRSRAERRRRRVARGLPAYTPADLASERRRNEKRGRVAYAQNRELVDGIKLARGCADCGYRAHACALQFDHLPGREKRGEVARLASACFGSFETRRARLLAEIAKCEVVCANCHAVRTQQRRNATEAPHAAE